jgi:hypothetical protein
VTSRKVLGVADIPDGELHCRVWRHHQPDFNAAYDERVGDDDHLVLAAICSMCTMVCETTIYGFEKGRRTYPRRPEGYGRIKATQVELMEEWLRRRRVPARTRRG